MLGFFRLNKERSMPVGKINWANIIAIVLQILSGLQPKPSPAPAAEHLAAVRSALAHAGTIEADIVKAEQFVVSHWAIIVGLITDAQAAFGG
jgi:hypothetical protein